MEIADLEGAIERGLSGVADSVKGLEQKEVARVEESVLVDTRMTTIEKLLKERRVPNGGDSKDRKGLSIRNLIMAIKNRSTKCADREVGYLKEWYQENAGMIPDRQKDLVTNIDTAGGFLVPAQFMGDQFIDLLRSKVVVMDLGAQDLSGLQSSPVEIPKLTGGATANFIGEGATITQSEETFGQLKLQTRQLAAIVPVSNLLLAQSSPSVDTIISNDLAAVIARAKDLAALKGTGASEQPLGIINDTAVPTSTLASVTIELLIDFQSTQFENNGGDVSLGWALSPAGWKIIRKLKDSDGRFFFNPDTAAEAATSILGDPYRLTTQLATTDVVYGDWNDLIIPSWGAMEIRASDTTDDAFKKNITYIRVIDLTDVGIRQANSFVATELLS